MIPSPSLAPDKPVSASPGASASASTSHQRGYATTQAPRHQENTPVFQIPFAQALGEPGQRRQGSLPC